jgi:hypothetical protein
MIFEIFRRIDSIARPDTKKAIAAWMKGVQSVDGRNWPAHFAEIFDRLFGRKHFGTRRFVRSAIASLTVSSGIAMLAAVKSGLSVDQIITSFTPPGVLFVVVFLLFLNIIPDYISLSKSRVIIGLMSTTGARSQGIIGTWFLWICYVAIDLCLTIIIFVISAFLALFFVLASSGWDAVHAADWTAVEDFMSVLSEAVRLNLFERFGENRYVLDDGIYGIFMYSTFFTSVWMWLYVLAGAAFRLLLTFQSVFGWLDRLIVLEGRPLTILGLIASVIAGSTCYFAIG